MQSELLPPVRGAYDLKSARKNSSKASVQQQLSPQGTEQSRLAAIRPHTSAMPLQQHLPAVYPPRLTCLSLLCAACAVL